MNILSLFRPRKKSFPVCARARICYAAALLTATCIANTTSALADVVLSTVTSPYGDATDYYADGDSLLNTDLTAGGNFNLFVGKSFVDFSPLATPVMLTVKNGAVVGENDYSVIYPDGGNYASLGTFGNSTTNIQGGNVLGAFGYENSITNISGGTLTNIFSYEQSSFNISGGSITHAYILGTQVNISGGTVANTNVNYGASVDISGGTLTNGLDLLDDTSTVNIFGTDLAYAYQGYFSSTKIDVFTVTGTLTDGTVYGGSNSPLRIRINSNSPGNSLPRQFTFNGSVVVPEASTFALLFPLLGIAGIVLARRRK